MADKLQVLVDKRDDLLRAVAAAWLHDMGRCMDNLIRYEKARGFKATKSRAKEPGQLNPHKAVFAASDLSRFAFSDERRPEREEEWE
jgi:HD superfamily phosphodiesterase